MNAAPNRPAAPRRVRCPGCGQPSEYTPDNAFRPFCSERCKNSDFGAWASERYRVETATPQDDEETPQGPTQSPH
jgi:endogenous inhibitor of DNA gyrase (YacG/DUF329 family)